MAYSLVQPSLAGGEISPSLYGRIDLENTRRHCAAAAISSSGSQAALKIVGFRFWGARNMQTVTAG